ncbi:MAG TPA: DnaJ domain-containing protein [Pyrinomonadaceae bacterium]
MGREEFQNYSLKNYYEILGVSTNASETEIKNAFRKLSLEHHPDKGGNENIFQYISEAYTTLKDSEKRKKYDLDNRFKTAPRTHNTRSPQGSPRSSSRHNAEHRYSHDSSKGAKEDTEHEKIYIVREGSGLFTKEYLADPLTGEKLGIRGYDKILVRDGLVIGQSGSGLLTSEFLLDIMTGRSVNIRGYDRIENRNGKAVCIRKANIFSSEIVEEITDNFGGNGYAKHAYRSRETNQEQSYNYKKSAEDIEEKLRKAREELDELYRKHEVKSSHEKKDTQNQHRPAYSQPSENRERKSESGLSIKKDGLYYYLTNETGRNVSNGYSSIEKRSSFFIGTDIFNNEVLLSKENGRELSRHYKNIKVYGNILIASTIADYQILLNTETGKELSGQYAKLNYADGLLIADDAIGYQRLINTKTGKEDSATYQEIVRKEGKVIGKSFYHEEEIKIP